MSPLLIVIIFFLALGIIFYFKREKFSVAQKGVCLICDQVFLDSELLEFDTKYFCSPDSRLYNDFDWKKVKTTQVSPKMNMEATLLQDIKDELKQKKIPSFITSEYIEKDGVIFTESSLFVRIEDIDHITEYIK